MPYISKDLREKLDKDVDNLIGRLTSEPEDVQDGELNYVVSRLLHGVYPLRYRHINRAVGVLECAKLEFYRKIAGPYEDMAIEKNGDIPPQRRS